MSVLPNTRLGRIEWFEQRLAAWAADPEAVGLTVDQIMALTPLVTAARTSYQAAQVARAESRGATLSFHTAEEALVATGRDLIATIKAFAETSDDPNVYVLANVPPPAPLSPAGPPNPPTDVRGAINSDGAVELKWSGSLAFRTFYDILRRLEGEPAWTLIDSVGAKSFLDSSVPVGATSVQYRVRAKRGEFTSAANEPITIRLGVEPQSGGPALSLAA